LLISLHRLLKHPYILMDLLNVSINAALEAGRQILEVYSRDFAIETKNDNSPLTEADKVSHTVIKQALAQTNIRLLSEEGKQIDFADRKSWDIFWLIDPIDGTKEFIKKTGEFTVNIALIKNGSPVMGVVYAPVTGALYFGAEDKGSFYYKVNLQQLAPVAEIIKNAKKLPLQSTVEVYTVVASKSHNTPETDVFIEGRRKAHGEITIVNAGSSIKLCLVAEGAAQVYPRLAPTMEWDTAAGHAVARFAGCNVYDYATKAELVYNKENLLNPWFVVEKLS